MSELYVLSDWTTVRIAGNERAAWLQNMCTQDVRQLQSGDGAESFVTDVKGKIVAHVFLLATSDSILALTVPGQANLLIAHWDRYIIREDVALSDDSGNWQWCALLGNNAAALLRNVTAASARLPTNHWDHQEVIVGGQTTLVVNAHSLLPGSLLLGSPPNTTDTLLDMLENNGAVRISDEQFAGRRIDARWPLLGVDFGQANLPQEVARNSEAISFTKGCYLGQETIARIDALGHVNQSLAAVRFDNDKVPQPGVELRAKGKVVGHVTTAGHSALVNAPAALAMLRRGANEPGTPLESDAGECEVFA